MTHNISLMKAATILVFLVMNEEGIECFLLYFSFWGFCLDMIAQNFCLFFMVDKVVVLYGNGFFVFVFITPVGYL